MAAEIDLFMLSIMTTPDFVSRKDKPGNHWHVSGLCPKALQKHAIFRIFRIGGGVDAVGMNVHSGIVAALTNCRSRQTIKRDDPKRQSRGLIVERALMEGNSLIIISCYTLTIKISDDERRVV